MLASLLYESPLPPLDEFLGEQGVRAKDLRVALEQWADEAEALLRHVDAFADPHGYLAGSDHLAAVQAFRAVL